LAFDRSRYQSNSEQCHERYRAYDLPLVHFGNLDTGPANSLRPSPRPSPHPMGRGRRLRRAALPRVALVARLPWATVILPLRGCSLRRLATAREEVRQ
jgi:hypothetical protein